MNHPHSIVCVFLLHPLGFDVTLIIIQFYTFIIDDSFVLQILLLFCTFIHFSHPSLLCMAQPEKDATGILWVGARMLPNTPSRSQQGTFIQRTKSYLAQINILLVLSPTTFSNVFWD